MARLPEGALMQRAATGLAVAVAEFLGSTYGARVLLLVGPATTAATRCTPGRGWRAAGARSRGAAACEGAPGGARGAACRRWSRRLVAEAEPAARRGGRRDRRDRRPNGPARRRPWRRSVAAVPVVAVDVPVRCRRRHRQGRRARTCGADVTVTFGTHKIGHLVDPAAQACGVVHLVDIGLQLPGAPVEALQAADVRRCCRCRGVRAQVHPRRRRDPCRFGDLPRRRRAVRLGRGDRPGRHGPLPGSAARRGACAPSRGRGRRRAGPGVGGRLRWRRGRRAALAEALADGVPAVVDADGLAHLTGHAGPVVLTPHAGELARMLDVEREEVESRPAGLRPPRGRQYDAVVLLKGRHTLVARPDGRVRVTTSGMPWLATAGAGDVLAGICGVVARGRAGSVRRGVSRVVAARCRGRARGRRRAAERGSVADAGPAVVRDLRT